jgi:hypothetical protein
VHEKIVRHLHDEHLDDQDFLEQAAAAGLVGHARPLAQTVKRWDFERERADRELLELHADPERLALLTSLSPDTYRRAQWRARLFARRERLAAERAGAPLNPEPSDAPVPPVVEAEKKRTPPSTDQVREGMVRRVIVAAKDQSTFERQLYDELEAARREYEEAGMPPDRIDGALQAIEARIRESVTRTRDDDDSHQQL